MAKKRFTADDARKLRRVVSPKTIEPLLLCAERHIRAACAVGECIIDNPFEGVHPKPSREVKDAAIAELRRRGFTVDTYPADHSDPRCHEDSEEVSW